MRMFFVVSMCIQWGCCNRRVDGCGSVGVSLLASAHLNRLDSVFYAGDWLLENTAVNFKKSVHRFTPDLSCI